MERCKHPWCEELVQAFTDRSKESKFFKTAKTASTGVVCFLSTPNPAGLCYYHEKKAQGLFEDSWSSKPLNPFWVDPPKQVNVRRSGGPHKRRRRSS